MNMIEKVARAIEENIAAALPAGVTVDYRYAALAAIEAMREPTEKMLDVGDEEMTSTGFSRQVYLRMISAALE